MFLVGPTAAAYRGCTAFTELTGSFAPMTVPESMRMTNFGRSLHESDSRAGLTSSLLQVSPFTVLRQLGSHRLHCKPFLGAKPGLFTRSGMLANMANHLFEQLPYWQAKRPANQLQRYHATCTRDCAPPPPHLQKRGPKMKTCSSLLTFTTFSQQTV